MRRLFTGVIAVVVGIGGLSIVPQSAEAAVPGALGRIAFVSTTDDPAGDVYTRPFAGGPWQRLTTGSSAELSPAWSPDGSQIAYASNAAGSTDIWMMNSDGTNQRNITKDPGNCYGPEFSPDGTRIAYTRIAADGTLEIWTMDPDGSKRVNVTATAPGDNSDPSWSPDGSKLAFSSKRTAQMGVYVMDANGSNVTDRLSDVNEWSSNPSWSPDGSRLAYESIRTGTTNISTVNVDGSNVTKITNRPAADTEPAWSPDGHHVLFMSRADGDFDLWMVDPDGSNLGHLTDDPGDELYGAWESVNRLPSAVDDSGYTVQPGGMLTGSSVLANDHDPDGDTLVAKLETPPKHAASFKLAPNGTFKYRHDGSAATTDTFTYRAEDARGGGSAPAKVTIRVPSTQSDTVGLVDPGTGVWRLRNGSGVVTEFFYGDPGDYPFVGDWDCDGVDTPGLYRQSDGFAYLRDSNTQGIADLTFFFGNPGDVPLAGDFDGDGCDTLSIYRPSEARFYIINKLGKDGGGLGAADYSFLFGDQGDKPVVGDWDGDGVDEIGLHRESSGFFYYRTTLSTGIADGQFFFGDPGDRFVAGDWGVVDGADTPGLFRPSNRVFYFRHSLTQGNADSQFTWSGAGSSWLPVAGDFNLN